MKAAGLVVLCNIRSSR